MWKQIWKKWTVDKPAAFGDLLWEVFVVQFAAQEVENGSPAEPRPTTTPPSFRAWPGLKRTIRLCHSDETSMISLDGELATALPTISKSATKRQQSHAGRLRRRPSHSAASASLRRTKPGCGTTLSPANASPMNSGAKSPNTQKLRPPADVAKGLILPPSEGRRARQNVRFSRVLRKRMWQPRTASLCCGRLLAGRSCVA